MHIQPSNLWTTSHMFLGAFVTIAVVQSRQLTDKVVRPCGRGYHCILVYTLGRRLTNMANTYHDYDDDGYSPYKVNSTWCLFFISLLVVYDLQSTFLRTRGCVARIRMTHNDFSVRYTTLRESTNSRNNVHKQSPSISHGERGQIQSISNPFELEINWFA